MFGSQRAAADSDTASPAPGRNKIPRPGPFTLRAGQENVHSLRPVPPHRTRRLGHFPRRRKMSVPMRTTCGGPGFASARWRWTATRPLPRPGPFALRAGRKTCTRCARSLCTARGVSDIFHDEGKCPFRCALRAEARASPQPGGGGQRHGLSRAPDRLLSARGKKTCTHCVRSLRTARGVSDIFHREGKCPFWGKRRVASPGCRARGRRTGLRLSQWWRTVSRYLPLCLRLPRAVPPACPVRPGAADGTPTSPRRAETRPSPAFVPLLIFRCPCYTVVKITA